MIDNRQNNNQKMSADQVWLSLLEDLKQTPLEIPETWTKETKAHWDSEELSLVVTVPHDTNEVWLDRRFLPLAKIYFGEEHTEKQLVLQRKGRAGMDDLLVRVQRSVYEEIIEPNKIVPVSIYMFHHWLPALGASPFWVVTAMRQVSFVSKSEENRVLKSISSRVLAKWSPLSRSQISERLNKKGFSCWFYKKVKEGYEDVAPEFNVWSQIPVAPHHLLWIENFFKQHSGEESAAAILESLLDRTGEIRRVKPGELGLPSSYSKQRRTLLDVVAEYFPGNISQAVSDLVIQLEHQITRPNLAVTIPHYFFHKYMGELNSNEAALIWYLRSLYKEDDSNVVKFTGYMPIKTALGCGNRTPQRLIEKCSLSQEEGSERTWDTYYQPEKLLVNWLSVVYLNDYEKGLAREYEIKIRATEPVHEDDKRYYNRQIERNMSSFQTGKKEGSELAQNRTGVAQNRTEGVRAEQGPEIFPDSKVAQNRTGVAQNHHGDAHNKPGVAQNNSGDSRISGHYNNSTTNRSLTDSFNDSLIPPPPGIGVPDLSTDLPVVGVGNINLEKLLGFGSYKHNEKKKIIELIEKEPELFLAWIIRNHITAAKFPVRLAVKNIQEGNETEDQYLEIARLGWEISAQLASVSENDLSMWELGIYDYYEGQDELIQVYKKLSKMAKKELMRLRETGYFQLNINVRYG
jgi:hypothetical protein